MFCLAWEGGLGAKQAHESIVETPGAKNSSPGDPVPPKLEEQRQVPAPLSPLLRRVPAVRTA
ncbi:unnamed protein product [Ectocarpus sp. CCAP 1310/34]|nr:unnamed protein product [Ectocarpus sp. CCAP 1310/34]